MNAFLEDAAVTANTCWRHFEEALAQVNGMRRDLASLLATVSAECEPGQFRQWCENSFAGGVTGATYVLAIAEGGPTK